MEILLNYLTTPNPVLDCTNCPPRPASRRSTAGSPNYDSPTILEDWNDFNIDSLHAMHKGSYKTALETRFDLHDYSYITEKPFRQIYDENSLESVLIKWTQSVVTEALAKTQTNNGFNSHAKMVFMKKGGQAYIDPTESDEPPVKSQQTKRRLPDWAGVLESSKCSGRPDNILPGDSKLSSKWETSKIRVGKTSTSKGDRWMGPINQIYTYCIRANARYGYLITDRELFAVRVRPMHTGPPHQNAANRAKRDGILEFKRIPWDNNKWTLDEASGELTVNLALWWLHMMVTAGHEVEDSYTPLKQIGDDSSDEEEEDSQAIISSQDQGPRTPSDNKSRKPLSDTHGQSFRSETSVIRQGISKTSFEQKNTRATPTPSRSGKKRARDEIEPGRTRSRTRQRRGSSQ